MVELLYDDDILTNFHVFSYGKIYKDNKVKYIFYDNQISLWLDKHVAVRIKKKTISYKHVMHTNETFDSTSRLLLNAFQHVSKEQLFITTSWIYKILYVT